MLTNRGEAGYEVLEMIMRQSIENTFVSYTA